MAAMTVQAAPTPAPPWPDMPIEPSWIEEGQPVARGTIVAQSQDRKVSSGFWECSEGRFKWEFAWDEFIRVIEGEVVVTDEAGESHTLKAGDTAHFPLGMKARWDVRKPVRKFFVIRTLEPFNL